MTVTFFGHRMITNEIKSELIAVLKDLIEQKQADTFYVGNQGGFDRTVISCLKELKRIYPHIKYYVALAYVPGKKDEYEYRDFENTIYPAVLEKTPPKFAIDKRNRWMISKADCVVTYVRTIGNARTYKELAEKKGKLVINLAD